MSEYKNINNDKKIINEYMLKKLYERVMEIEEDFVRAQETKPEVAVRNICKLITKAVETKED